MWLVHVQLLLSSLRQQLLVQSVRKMSVILCQPDHAWPKGEESVWRCQPVAPRWLNRHRLDKAVCFS